MFTNILAEELKIFGLFYVCDRTVTLDYHRGMQEFSTKLFKQIAYQNNDHFVSSPYSIWLALAAFAEGSEGVTQKQLFEFLNLPKNQCLREKYYEIATSLESPGNDVFLKRQRLFILDDILKVNDTWMTTVRSSGLIDTKIAPIRGLDLTANQLPEFKMSEFEVNGNSLVLDTLDYEGLWTTAFDNSSIQKSYFYNDEGEMIGHVDLLRIKKRVRLCYVPFLNAKLLELPVGNNGRYRMLFILNLGNNGIRRTVEKFPSSFIIDSLPLLVETAVPADVAIPKFRMTTEIDYMKVLDSLGMKSIWKDGNANR